MTSHNNQFINFEHQWPLQIWVGVAQIRVPSFCTGFPDTNHMVNWFFSFSEQVDLLQLTPTSWKKSSPHEKDEESRIPHPFLNTPRTTYVHLCLHKLSKPQDTNTARSAQGPQIPSGLIQWNNQGTSWQNHGTSPRSWTMKIVCAYVGQHVFIITYPTYQHLLKFQHYINGYGHSPKD